MIRWFVWAPALLVLAGPVSCLEDVGPEPFTTADTCLVGETRSCDDCRGNARGIQRCLSDGKFSEECSCEGCTASPDCNECDEEDDCFNTCMCRSESVADPIVCELACEDESDGAGGRSNADAGPTSGGRSSGGGNNMGGSNQGAGGGGTTQCPPVTVLGIMAEGCCRPNGMCGVVDTLFMTGCVAPAFGGTAEPCQTAR